MDATHIAALAAARDTHQAVIDLLAEVARLSSMSPETDVRWNKEDHGIYWVLFSTGSTWAEPLDGWVEVCVADKDYWSEVRNGVPAIGVGIALGDEYYEEVRSHRLRPWRERLAREGIEVTVFDRYVRIWGTRYLDHLPATDQAQYIATWLDEVIAFLVETDPGLTRLA